MTVNGNLLAEYVSYVSGAMNAFLPLLSAVVGAFVAFAILNMIRHFVLKIK